MFGRDRREGTSGVWRVADARLAWLLAGAVWACAVVGCDAGRRARLANYRVLFSAPSPGTPGIDQRLRTVYRRQADGAALTPLTPTGQNCGIPVPSRDGRYVAMQLVRGEGTGREYQLAVLEAQSGRLATLARSRRPFAWYEWLPDARRVMFSWRTQDGGSQTALVDVPTKATTRVLRGLRWRRAPSASASARLAVAVAWSGDRLSRLVVTPLNAAGRPVLFETPVGSEVSIPVWHPSREVVAWAEGDQVTLLPVPGRPRRLQLRLPGSNPASEGLSWSPDGQTLFLVAATTRYVGIIALNVSTGEQRTLLQPRKEGFLSGAPVWAEPSPDGRLLLCHFFNDVDVGHTWGILDLASRRVVPLKWAKAKTADMTWARSPSSPVPRGSHREG